MSIPPLVCSTPPPPDQCEDDKDPEDFDEQYNLSQDEDEENYDYGSFATYNHFQSAKGKSDVSIITKVIESEIVIDTSKGDPDSIELVLGTNITHDSEIKFEEDVNIEDLNLDIDQEAAERSDLTIDQQSETNVDALQELETPEKTNISLDNITRSPEKYNTQLDKVVLEPPSINQAEKFPTCVDETTDEDLQFATELVKQTEVREEIKFKEEQILGSMEVECDETKQVIDENDDFGDFEDFQCAGTEKTPATQVQSCDNPWDSSEVTEVNFGDFKANFDDKESNSFHRTNMQPEHSTEIDDKPETNIEKTEEDDFGDFNDFTSSSLEPGPVEESQMDFNSIPLLDLNSFENEEDLLRTINERIESMCVPDDDDKVVEEPQVEPDVNLETVLGITWAHILETETRQPYMVNWNNSLGQKTLLKALCIDSRNILFGPKWNYNMPKYAVNLMAAPLQPQKKTAVATTIESVNPEKIMSKDPGTWSDPFASAGQESCTTDTQSENPVIEIGPTDLDVFEASTSSKPDKIFSSTINVQPLRQINLPDTHIFTPTDSETPRSTTIHYDSSPTVLLPQTVIEVSKSGPESLPNQSNSKTVDDDEYWEFQDFKGTANTLKPNTPNQASEKSEVSKTNTNITHATQLLQPVKIEPTIPTLNWPDPGEVKETFEDFTDFVSNSKLSTQQPDTPINESRHEIEKPGSSSVVMPKEGITEDTLNDEFATFQSALPTASSLDFGFGNFTSNMSAKKPSNVPPEVVLQIATDFENAFPKLDNVKSDPISVENVSRSKVDLAQNQIPFFPSNFEVMKSTEFSAKIPPIQPPNIPMLNTNLLQPTVASSSATLQSQHKSAQILQPLSLESYSQINWPNPGIDLQDLSRFNPVETLQSLKTDLGVNSQNKVASPVHNQKSSTSNQIPDDDIWGEFVSSKPKPQQQQQQAMPKKQSTFGDDNEWTDFVSSPSVKPQNGLNTISLNVHTNLNSQKSNSNKFKVKNNQLPLEIPTLNYVTPKSTTRKTYNERHFQNL